MEKVNLRHINRIFYSVTAEYIFFSSVYGTFLGIPCVRSQNKSQYKKTESIKISHLTIMK